MTSHPTHLVTGGSGFLGSALRRRLSSAGLAYTNLDRAAPSSTPENETHVRADIRDAEALTEAMQRHTTVFHLAAEWNDVGVPEDEYRTTNIEGTRNVAEAAAATGVRSIVFLSSCSVYDFNGSDLPFEEDHAAEQPPTIYGRTKMAGEKVLAEWAEQDADRSLLIVRPSVIYGPGNRGNVYNLARQVLSGKFVLPKGAGAHKSISYVDNVAEFLLFASGGDRPGARVFNYCDQPQLTTDELVHTIRRLGQVRRPLPAVAPSWLLAAASLADRGPRAVKDRFGTMKVSKFLTSTHLGTARLEETGFRQPRDTEEGLRTTIDWIRSRHSSQMR